MKLIIFSFLTFTIDGILWAQEKVQGRAATPITNYDDNTSKLSRGTERNLP